MRIALISGAAHVPDAFRFKSDHLFRLAGGNIGNFAITNSLLYHLKANADIVPWEINPDFVREHYDLIVFACANMLGSHTDLGGMAVALEKMALPIIAIGLGAQADDINTDVHLTPGTKRWLDTIADHNPSALPNIGMRGEFSLRQAQRYGHGDRALIIGCPSNLTNPDPDLGAKIELRRSKSTALRVAVPAGMCHWPHLMVIERELIRLVNKSDGAYIAQHDIDMVRLCNGEFDDIEPSTLMHMQRYLAPDLSMDEFKHWCERYGTTYIDAGSWMQAMKKFDFVVGPRFHGVMLGIQAGVPGGVISHDSRTLEMCETMLIPVRPLNDMPRTFDSQDLMELFPFDAQAYCERRLQLRDAYLTILEGAGITAPAELSQM